MGVFIQIVFEGISISVCGFKGWWDLFLYWFIVLDDGQLK